MLSILEQDFANHLARAIATERARWKHRNLPGGKGFEEPKVPTSLAETATAFASAETTYEFLILLATIEEYEKVVGVIFANFDQFANLLDLAAEKRSSKITEEEVDKAEKGEVKDILELAERTLAKIEETIPLF